MQSQIRSRHARPSTAPAYYLGRPAHLWMTIPSARRHRRRLPSGIPARSSRAG
jgi:hypothetical protein